MEQLSLEERVEMENAIEEMKNEKNHPVSYLSPKLSQTGQCSCLRDTVRVLKYLLGESRAFLTLEWVL